MNRLKRVPLAVWMIAGILCSMSGPGIAQDNEKMREQFEDVLAGVNQGSFEPIKTAIEKGAFLDRVMRKYMLETEVKNAFDENFWEIVEGIAMSSMPNAKQKANGEIVKFEFADGNGQAVVRFKLPGYVFSYQVWNLQQRRGRLRVLDWFNSNQGRSVVDAIAEELLVMMPNNGATRRLIRDKNPTNQQLFQTTELLKAARDRQVSRFFEIYDGLSEPIRNDELVAMFALQLAYGANDRGRFIRTFNVFVDVFGANPDFGEGISNSQLLMGQIEAGYQSLLKFHDSMQFGEGALPSKLSALALALGNNEKAIEHAEHATRNEPTLALAWWSLLRARASIDDFSGSIVAMERLEDDFGQQLDAAQLMRDPYGAFEKLAESPAFVEWRASR